MPVSAPPATGAFTLDWLLAPLSTEEFRDRYWEKDFLHLQRGDPDYCSGLFSFADVDRALYLARESQREAISLVPPPDAGRPSRSFRAKDVPVETLSNAFQQGETLGLSGLQAFWPAAGRLAAALQEDLDARVNVNAYLTRAGTQGFSLHFDTHDVLVLQVGGAKDWFLYDPVVPLPISSFDYAGHIRAGFNTMLPEDGARLRRQIRLRSGDLLYMPRGLPHKAIASDEPSLHLAIGIHSLYWVDVLKAAVDLLAVREPELRRALPPEFFAEGEPAPEVEARFRELLALAQASAPLGDARRALRNAQLAKRFTPPDGHFQQLVDLGALTLESEVERRAGIPCSVSTRGDTARIDFGANHVAGPAGLAPALEFIRGQRRFRVADIPGLSDSSKLVLAQRLVREGLLRAAEGT